VYRKKRQNDNSFRFEETAKQVSAKLQDFVRFTRAVANGERATIAFIKGKHTYNLDSSNGVLYLNDLDLKQLPGLKQVYMDHFKLPEILPGGSQCITHQVSYLLCIRSEISFVLLNY